MQKIWKMAEPVSVDLQARFPELNQIVLQLLVNRGLTTQAVIDGFLSPDYLTDLHDPFLFSQMDKAVKRILSAIEAQEHIMVYGDYDADGVTSTAVMIEALTALGATHLDRYIPYRETEGYGLNPVAVKKIADDGVTLVITVDCGITGGAEIDILNAQNVDVIITDHHHAPVSLPKAYAIINQNVPGEPYPFKDLTGVGVAFKVAQALVARHASCKVTQLAEGFEKWLLDLVAIGTIADIQPLLGENRVFATYGLVVINRTRRIGLQKLLASLNNKTNHIDERVVGWQIVPRLNAAGRLNHASTAYELLTTQDETEATRLSQELSQTNQERQQITEKIRDEARKQIGTFKDQNILIVVGEEWPTGIVGLVAGKIADEFHRPTLVISRFKGEIIGSARSIAEFNVIEAIEQCADFLKKFGGHPQAAGFTIDGEEGLQQFIQKMTTLADAQLTGKDIPAVLSVDTEIDLDQVNWELFEALEKFPPYGEDNPKPRFLAKQLTVVDHQKLGKGELHMRLMVSHTKPVIRKTIGFNLGEWCNTLKRGDKVDMVFEVDVNEWNGNRELQMKIVDLKMSL